ncbi:MAG: SGNH/GDSL hydrolase family protein [Clostridia bacterium]|nr:SGNH/GDSL hydrolase family protein [Clostridia bacterium]
MKRTVSILLISAMLLTTLALFGCQSAPPVDEPDTAPDEPSVPEVPAEPDEPSAPSVPYINEENLARLIEPTTDLVDDEAFARATQYNRRANVTLLQSVMNRAKAGESITVATIGGSITAGTASSNKLKTSYSAIFRDWWVDSFPDANVTLVNAGIGATTSYLGVHRVQKDIIDKGADVCIIEFSVNDYSDSYFKLTYESLVARLLHNDIAVILLFMVKQTGASTQQNNATTGIEMGVPMISYGDAVMPLIEAGELAWEDISPDDIHPNDDGHAIVGELLHEFLNMVFVYTPNEVTVVPTRKELLTQTKYFNSYLLDSQSLEADTVEGFAPTAQAYSTFQNGWRTMNGGVIEFTATFSRMGAMYRKTVDGKSGKCQVFVDGKLVATLDGDYTGGWGDYDRTDQFFSSRKTEEHTVRLVVEDGMAFTLVRLLVAE